MLNEPFRSIPCLVSCLSKRMLHSNVKTFDVIFKKMREESTRAVELALEGHSLFISGQTLMHQRAASDLEIIDCFCIASCCIVFVFFLNISGS